MLANRRRAPFVGARLYTCSSAVPPRTTSCRRGMMYVIVASSTQNADTSGASTTMTCPRTPNSSPSWHSSRAPSPVQFTTRSATPRMSPSESRSPGEAGASGEHSLFEPFEIHGHVDDGKTHGVSVGISRREFVPNRASKSRHEEGPRRIIHRIAKELDAFPQHDCRRRIDRGPQEFPQCHAGPSRHTVGRLGAIRYRLPRRPPTWYRAHVPAPIPALHDRLLPAAVPDQSQTRRQNDNPHVRELSVTGWADSVAVVDIAAAQRICASVVRSIWQVTVFVFPIIVNVIAEVGAKARSRSRTCRRHRPGCARRVARPPCRARS